MSIRLADMLGRASDVMDRRGRYAVREVVSYKDDSYILIIYVINISDDRVTIVPEILRSLYCTNRKMANTTALYKTDIINVSQIHWAGARGCVEVGAFSLLLWIPVGNYNFRTIVKTFSREWFLAGAQLGNFERGAQVYL